MRLKHTYAPLRILALLLALFCGGTALFGCKKGSDVPLSPGLSVIEGEPIYDKNVAVQTDNFKVTPGMMAYFFYTIGGTLMPQMQAQKPYDQSKNLHDQLFTDTLSWYDAIMNATLEHVSQLLLYNEAAKEAGEGLSDEESLAVTQSMMNYRTVAAMDNMSIDAYLQQRYGPKIEERDLRAVLEMESVANRYSITLTERLEGAITAEAIRAYAAEAGLSDDTRSRNVSYLYIAHTGGVAPTSTVQAALAAVEESPTAQTVAGLSEYGLPGTEEHLTPENSGIDGIGAWLFAEGRRVGDVGAVDLGGATYILLYTGDGMTYAEVTARMALFDAAYADWYNALLARVTFGYNYDCLDGYDVEK